MQLPKDYWPLSKQLAIVPLSAGMAVTIGIIVLLYVFTAERLKHWFFRRMADEPHQMGG